MKRRGVGYASMFYGTGYGNGFPDESRATALIKQEGCIIINVGVSEVGSGGHSVMWQIATEALGVKKELIKIQHNDTSKMHDSGTAAASRQTYNTGNAVLDACRKLRENMIKAMENQSISLIEDSEVIIQIYQQMILKGIETKIEGYFKATSSEVNLETGQGDPYWPYTFGLQKAVVEVDDETGKVDVVDIVAIFDAGKIVNPALAEGQSIGGTAMGIGYAIMEEIQLDNGVIKNRNFSDYIIPTSKDVPNIKTYFIEDLEDTGPYGAKGLGEPVMLPTAPAIINAIYDAIGVRIYDFPATCERVLQAIKNKESKK
ncbi:molybdopterin-dependent oxidoreductase [Mycoplasmatota bacterium]|nr:molybdopterin-dependent oxidoreductase [Mycoplasmatota bacterium]